VLFFQCRAENKITKDNAWDSKFLNFMGDIIRQLRRTVSTSSMLQAACKLASKSIPSVLTHAMTKSTNDFMDSVMLMGTNRKQTLVRTKARQFFPEVSTPSTGQPVC
jgi:hypothetical protein